jgi:shikimate dehydrogenase
MRIGGATQVFALLGDPVAHSLSPAMHNAAFTALGLDATYVALRCESATVRPLMETLARQGGGGNVTIPHKEVAAAVLDPAHTGSPVYNTFWGRDGRLEGAETDSHGILATLQRLGAPGGAWCLIGTGGSARAALAAATRSGAAIAVRSRTPGRADAFAVSAREAGVSLVEPDSCRIVINCTPLGLSRGDPLPVSPREVPKAELALDLVYRNGETPWVHAMRAAGRRAADGREVLVEQGALAFECWFPGRPAPREVMRAAVRAALE